VTTDHPDESAELSTDPHLVVNIGELTRRTGNRQALPVHTMLVAPTVAGILVPDAEPVTGTLELEAVINGIVVTGSLVAPWTGECRRCLDPLHGTVTVAVRELFETTPTPGDSYPIEGDHIDLNPLVRDAVLLALPLSPLCREDCAGPDPERFPAVVEDLDAGAAPAVGDDRWAALSELRFDE
jgi:uncharacterized protein